MNCKICEKTFEKQAEYLEHRWSLMHHIHLERVYGRNTVHKCDLCLIELSDLRKYRKHLECEQHMTNVAQAHGAKKQKRNGSSQIVANNNGSARIYVRPNRLDSDFSMHSHRTQDTHSHSVQEQNYDFHNDDPSYIDFEQNWPDFPRQHAQDKDPYQWSSQWPSNQCHSPYSGDGQRQQRAGPSYWSGHHGQNMTKHNWSQHGNFNVRSASEGMYQGAGPNVRCADREQIASVSAEGGSGGSLDEAGKCHETPRRNFVSRWDQPRTKENASVQDKAQSSEDRRRMWPLPKHRDDSIPSTTEKQKQDKGNDDGKAAKDKGHLDMIIDDVLKGGSGKIPESSSGKEDGSAVDRGAKLLKDTDVLTKELRYQREHAKLRKELALELRKEREKLRLGLRSSPKGSVLPSKLTSQDPKSKGKPSNKPSLLSDSSPKTGAQTLSKPKKALCENMNKESLMQLINMPRSHKERMKIQRILRQYSGSQKPSIRPRLNLLQDKTSDNEAETDIPLDLNIEELPADIKTEITSLFDSVIMLTDLANIDEDIEIIEPDAVCKSHKEKDGSKKRSDDLKDRRRDADIDDDIQIIETDIVRKLNKEKEHSKKTSDDLKDNGRDVDRSSSTISRSTDLRLNISGRKEPISDSGTNQDTLQVDRHPRNLSINDITPCNLTMESSSTPALAPSSPIHVSPIPTSHYSKDLPSAESVPIVHSESLEKALDKSLDDVIQQLIQQRSTVPGRSVHLNPPTQPSSQLKALGTTEVAASISQPSTPPDSSLVVPPITIAPCHDWDQPEFVEPLVICPQNEDQNSAGQEVTSQDEEDDQCPFSSSGGSKRRHTRSSDSGGTSPTECGAGSENALAYQETKDIASRVSPQAKRAKVDSADSAAPNPEQASLIPDDDTMSGVSSLNTETSFHERVPEKGLDRCLNTMLDLSIREEQLIIELSENDNIIEELEGVIREAQIQMQKRRDHQQKLLLEQDEIRLKRTNILRGAVGTTTNSRHTSESEDSSSIPAYTKATTQAQALNLLAISPTVSGASSVQSQVSQVLSSGGAGTSLVTPTTMSSITTTSSAPSVTQATKSASTAAVPSPVAGHPHGDHRPSASTSTVPNQPGPSTSAVPNQLGASTSVVPNQPGASTSTVPNQPGTSTSAVPSATSDGVQVSQSPDPVNSSEKSSNSAPASARTLHSDTISAFSRLATQAFNSLQKKSATSSSDVNVDLKANQATNQATDEAVSLKTDDAFSLKEDQKMSEDLSLKQDAEESAGKEIRDDTRAFYMGVLDGEHSELLETYLRQIEQLKETSRILTPDPLPLPDTTVELPENPKSDEVFKVPKEKPKKAKKVVVKKKKLLKLPRKAAVVSSSDESSVSGSETGDKAACKIKKRSKLRTEQKKVLQDYLHAPSSSDVEIEGLEADDCRIVEQDWQINSSDGVNDIADYSSQSEQSTSEVDSDTPVRGVVTLRSVGHATLQCSCCHQNVIFFGCSDGSIYSTDALNNFTKLTAASSGVVCLQWVNDSTRGSILVAGCSDNSLHAYTYEKKKRVLNQVYVRQFDAVPTSLAYSSPHIYVGLANGYILTLNAKVEVLSAFIYKSMEIVKLTVVGKSPNELLCVIFKKDNVIQIFDTSHSRVHFIKAHTRPPLTMVVSYNKLVSAGLDNTIYVHDCQTGQRLAFTRTASPITAMALDHRNLLLVGMADGTVSVYKNVFKTSPKSKKLVRVHNHVVLNGCPVHTVDSILSMVYIGGANGQVANLDMVSAESSHRCQYKHCRVGFGDKKHLKHHLLHTHFMTRKGKFRRCVWKYSCGFHSTNKQAIVKHINQHLSEDAREKSNKKPTFSHVR